MMSLCDSEGSLTDEEDIICNGNTTYKAAYTTVSGLLYVFIIKTSAVEKPCMILIVCRSCSVYI